MDVLKIRKRHGVGNAASTHQNQFPVIGRAWDNYREPYLPDTCVSAVSPASYSEKCLVRLLNFSSRDLVKLCIPWFPLRSSSMLLWGYHTNVDYLQVNSFLKKSQKHSIIFTFACLASKKLCIFIYKDSLNTRNLSTSVTKINYFSMITWRFTSVAGNFFAHHGLFFEFSDIFSSFCFDCAEWVFIYFCFWSGFFFTESADGGLPFAENPLTAVAAEFDWFNSGKLLIPAFTHNCGFMEITYGHDGIIDFQGNTNKHKGDFQLPQITLLCKIWQMSDCITYFRGITSLIMS